MKKMTKEKWDKENGYDSKMTFEEATEQYNIRYCDKHVFFRFKKSSSTK
jgi:hypothetical protein